MYLRKTLDSLNKHFFGKEDFGRKACPSKIVMNNLILLQTGNQQINNTNNLVLLLIAIFVAVIGIMIALRAKFGEKFEIKTSDILLALIPIAIWLVLSGKVKVIELGGLFKMEAALVEASQSEVAPQVTSVKLPVEPIQIDPKRGVEAIPRLISNKTEALSFQLGHGRYYGSAIEEYLTRLSQHPFFKYVIINQSDGQFVGIVDARKLYSALSADETEYNTDNFARWLNSSDISALSNLPGYISAKNAIKKDTDKQTALEKMEKLDLEILPVVNEKDKFVGVVDRTRLVSSLIIEVVRKVK